MEKDSVLEMRHIYKTFPGVKALQNVDFTLKKGEIHALMGENGAGKSTLIKVLTGVEEFETGEIMIDGVSMLLLNVPFLNGVSSDLHKRMRFYALQEGLLPPVKTFPLPEGVLKVPL